MMDTDKDLPARLRAHAALHDALTSPYDDEQKQWAQDLRDAAEFIESMAKAGMIYGGVVGIPVTIKNVCRDYGLSESDHHT